MTNTASCTQVVAIQRLHRAVRSAVALPCSVVFSSPHDHTGFSSAGSNSKIDFCNPNVDGGDDGSENTTEENFHRALRQDAGWRRHWGGGEGLAVLTVEVRILRGHLHLNEELFRVEYAVRGRGLLHFRWYWIHCTCSLGVPNVTAYLTPRW